jgi:hypothetical protein
MIQLLSTVKLPAIKDGAPTLIVAEVRGRTCNGRYLDLVADGEWFQNVAVERCELVAPPTRAVDFVLEQVNEPGAYSVGFDNLAGETR